MKNKLQPMIVLLALSLMITGIFSVPSQSQSNMSGGAASSGGGSGVVPLVTCGTLNTTSCVLTGFGSTSGTATITWPAVAGTTNNAIVSSNQIRAPGFLFPDGNCSLPASGLNQLCLNGGAVPAISLGTSSSFFNLAATNVVNTFSGGINTFTQIGTGTNCIANGSAANPSVVACGSSAAGMFSCATNASTGTCQVNTTAVTANSEISITQDQADGGASQLNVTCNTGLDLAAAAPVLKTKATGASFTINLGTVTANPACFEYFIVN